MDLWSWVLTATGVTMFVMAGRGVWWCWYIGLGINQPLWAIYALVTEQWGFLASCAFYTAVYAHNAFVWTRKHRQQQAPVAANE